MFSRLVSEEMKGRGKREERQPKSLASKTFRSKRWTAAKRDFQLLWWADWGEHCCTPVLLRDTSQDIWRGSAIAGSRPLGEPRADVCGVSTNLEANTPDQQSWLLTADSFSQSKRHWWPLEPQEASKSFKFCEIVRKPQKCQPKSATGILLPKQWKQPDQPQAKCIFVPKRWLMASLIQCQLAFPKHPTAFLLWQDDMNPQYIKH